MQRHNPLVSIIIPTYNRSELMRETLQSVQIQSYHNWECIVVDDCSTDNTIFILNEFIKEDSRFILLNNKRTKGAPGARNIGIENARGEYLYFFDSDDIMYSDLLFSFLKEFESNKEIDFCCCENEFFNSSEIVKRSNNSKLIHNIESHLENYGFTTQSFFTKKNVINSIGFWNESLHRLQDVEYFSRLFSTNKKGLWIDKILFKIRIHENNISSTWNEKTSESLINVHKIIAVRFQNKLSEKLKVILGRRITAFSISALASGYFSVAIKNFWFGLNFLPFTLKIKRLTIFFKLLITKPFTKNKEDILMYY